MQTEQTAALPELPKPKAVGVWGYTEPTTFTEEQMREYAIAAVALATKPAGAADSTEPVARDPLQGASDWLKQALVDCTVGDIQRQLLIGYNRARRLFDSQPLAAEAVPPASCPRWRLLDDVPSKTGRYIVKHRGEVGGDAYYTAKAGDTHYPVGWAQVPDFGPTHWLDEEGVEWVPGGHQIADDWRAKHLPSASNAAEPAGGKDAARYRWLRENGAELFYASANLEGDALDAAVDAGMKEQGHD